MISPCYFIDLDTQEAFVGAQGVLASNKQTGESFLAPQTFRENLNLLTKHALKKKWLVLSPVECTKDAKKIRETSVKGAFTIGEKQKFAAADYKKLLKKHRQLVFEKNNYDVLKNRHFLKMLKAGGIKTCVVYGVALDYGLETLVLQLMKSGFHVYIPVDAVKAINEENRRMALVELRKYGAEMWNTEFIVKNT